MAGSGARGCTIRGRATQEKRLQQAVAPRTLWEKVALIFRHLAARRCHQGPSLQATRCGAVRPTGRGIAITERDGLAGRLHRDRLSQLLNAPNGQVGASQLLSAPDGQVGARPRGHRVRGKSTFGRPWRLCGVHRGRIGGRSAAGTSAAKPNCVTVEVRVGRRHHQRGARRGRSSGCNDGHLHRHRSVTVNGGTDASPDTVVFPRHRCASRSQLHSTMRGGRAVAQPATGVGRAWRRLTGGGDSKEDTHQGIGVRRGSVRRKVRSRRQRRSASACRGTARKLRVAARRRYARRHPRRGHGARRGAASPRRRARRPPAVPAGSLCTRGARQRVHRHRGGHWRRWRQGQPPAEARQSGFGPRRQTERSVSKARKGSSGRRPGIGRGHPRRQGRHWRRRSPAWHSVTLNGHRHRVRRGATRRITRKATEPTAPGLQPARGRAAWSHHRQSLRVGAEPRASERPTVLGRCWQLLC